MTDNLRIHELYPRYSDLVFMFADTGRRFVVPDTYNQEFVYLDGAPIGPLTPQLLDTPVVKVSEHFADRASTFLREKRGVPTASEISELMVDTWNTAIIEAAKFIGMDPDRISGLMKRQRDH